MTWSTSPTLPGRFADLIQEIGRALGMQHAWLRAFGPLSSLIWARLCGMRRRLTALAERVRTGTLPAKAPPRPRPRQAKPRPPAAPDQPRLPPQSPGWLIKLVPEPHHLAAWRYPLEQLLADPETIALTAAAPQAGRILRPLCRMLLVDVPEYLRLPPRPRRPRPPRPRRPLTQDQHDARVRRMGRLAYAQLINPEVDGKPNGSRPPNRIGYGRPKPFPKPDSAG